VRNLCLFVLITVNELTECLISSWPHMHPPCKLQCPQGAEGCLHKGIFVDLWDCRQCGWS